MSAITLEVASRSDPGRMRQFNEDSVAVDPSGGIAALADGMGSRHGAEIASRLATARVIEHLRRSGESPPERAVREAFASANQAICAHAKTDPNMKGMGTTLVSTWFRGDRVSIANVGDSRAYRYRAGQLERLTIDHSFVQEQLVAGNLTDSEARSSQSRHIVTRALGAEEQVAPDLAEHEVKTGDIYMLCSDGLHDLVDDADIALALEVLSPNLDLAASTLVAMANDRGGLDNISVVLVKVKPPGRAAASEKAVPVLEKTSAEGGLLGWIRSRFTK